MKGYEIVTILKELITDNDIVISSNGNISREVFNLLPQPQVYLRGSMGLPVAVGFGLALAQPEQRVIVITGDGNFLMGLNSLVTTAFYKPDNLKILILDNNRYFTTGGQQTVSSIINNEEFFASLNIGFKKSRVAKKENVRQALEKLLAVKTFAILHLQIDSGKLPLENIPWHPEKITKKIRIKINELEINK